MKKLTNLLLLTITIFALNSCEDARVQCSYVNTIYSFSSSAESFGMYDKDLISVYATVKGLKLDEVYYIEGDSKEENDDLAIASFNAIISTFSISEIEQLGLDATTKFSIDLVGATTSGDENLVLSSFEYPAN